MSETTAMRTQHWLLFDADHKVTGCRCGFAADPGDEGWGDSVVEHLLAAPTCAAVKVIVRHERAVEAARAVGDYDYAVPVRAFCEQLRKALGLGLPEVTR